MDFKSLMLAQFIQQRLQILHLGLHYEEFNSAYLFAWWEGVYPLLSDSDGSVMTRPHEIYSDVFSVPKAKVEIVYDRLLQLYDHSEETTFYDIEDEFGISGAARPGEFGGYSWSRSDLVYICKYLYLEDAFPKEFWERVLNGQCPSEAHYVKRDFNIATDITLMW